ncbi:MAG: universal stress protein [Balneolales bacterium]
MRKLNRILVPTDFSEGSQAAYQYARKVTDLCGGQVNLIHVIPTMEYFSESLKDVGYPKSIDQPTPTPEDEIKAWLEKDMLEYFDQEHQGDIVLKTGRKSYQEVIDEAGQEVYDLVVMGKNGYHQSTTMGNVTEKVIRHSPKPVLTINKDSPPREIKRLLVPTDYSNYSLQALHPATMLASGLGGEIILYHVMKLYGSPAENESMIPDQDVEDAVRMKLINRVDSYLQARSDWDKELAWDRSGRTGHILIKDKEGEETIPFTIVIQRAVGAHHGITDYASDHADLIIINTHGQSGFSRIFMGSTTEKVTYQANKPVLSIRAVEEKEAVVDE